MKNVCIPRLKSSKKIYFNLTFKIHSENHMPYNVTETAEKRVAFIHFKSYLKVFKPKPNVNEGQKKSPFTPNTLVRNTEHVQRLYFYSLVQFGSNNAHINKIEPSPYDFSQIFI